MTLFLLLIFIAVAVILFRKNQLSVLIGENHKLVLKLKNTSWIQNHWMSGIFLFFVNGTLFFITIILLFLLGYLDIPYFHLLVMVVAVFGSFFFWMILNKAWQGTNANRIKMSILGSSFYFLGCFRKVCGFYKIMY
ncbi:hypothetical protein [Gottfriedia acidiceleris]|uniref:hypothetical protein n=1 Tax=Gottfriedia acidiceleris TaxID=371036 RepID=UPI000B43D307|nr:hypothetical protein [Gottfriedia acidiceleris]